MEEALTGYVEESARLNEKGESIKEEIALLVRPSEKEPDNTLRAGCFDIILNLSLDAQIAEKRATNRRLDPTTGVVYNLEDNLPPIDEKGLAERL